MFAKLADAKINAPPFSSVTLSFDDIQWGQWVRSHNCVTLDDGWIPHVNSSSFILSTITFSPALWPWLQVEIGQQVQQRQTSG